jgi:hypothetical protein
MIPAATPASMASVMMIANRMIFSHLHSTLFGCTQRRAASALGSRAQTAPTLSICSTDRPQIAQSSTDWLQARLQAIDHLSFEAAHMIRRFFA